jgi:hypothetical protein
MQQNSGPCDHGGGHRRAPQRREAAVVPGAVDPRAGGEQAEIAVPLGDADDLVGRRRIVDRPARPDLLGIISRPDSADGNDVRVGRGIGEARCALVGVVVVTRGDRDEKAILIEGCEVVVERDGRRGRIVAAAERQIDGDDVVLGLVRDDPLQARVDRRPGAVGVGVEHLEGNEVDIGSDAGILRAGRADDARDVAAVAVVVHRIAGIVDEVPAGDDPFAPAAPEGRVVIVDTGVEHGHAVAVPPIGIIGLGRAQANERPEAGVGELALNGCLPRDVVPQPRDRGSEAFFQGFDRGAPAGPERGWSRGEARSAENTPQGENEVLHSRPDTITWQTVGEGPAHLKPRSTSLGVRPANRPGGRSASKPGPTRARRQRAACRRGEEAARRNPSRRMRATAARTPFFRAVRGLLRPVVFEEAVGRRGETLRASG